MPERKVVSFIDLFSGAGGLAQGFRQASDPSIEYRSVFAVELEPSFAATYKANFGHEVFCGPIEDVRQVDLPKADLIIGGPPCQGFSPLGKMSPTDRHPTMNKLWRHYFRILEWVRPKAFVVENVPEFLRSDQYPRVKSEAGRLGYTVIEAVLNAAEFGVPQQRRRGFLVGVLKGTPRLPAPGPDQITATVMDAIGDLVDEPLVFDFSNGTGKSHPISTLHIGRNPTQVSLKRYKCVPPGGNRFDLMRKRPDLTPRCWLEKPTGSTDVFGRMEWGKPSLTIRTEFFKPEKGCYLHPSLHRPITHREAARLQTFPDDYLFCGSKLEIARQIGNAVPPKLAQAVASELKSVFIRSKTSNNPANGRTSPPGKPRAPRAPTRRATLKR